MKSAGVLGYIQFRRDWNNESSDFEEFDLGINFRMPQLVDDLSNGLAGSRMRGVADGAEKMEFSRQCRKTGGGLWSLRTSAH